MLGPQAKHPGRNGKRSFHQPRVCTRTWPIPALGAAGEVNVLNALLCLCRRAGRRVRFSPALPNPLAEAPRPLWQLVTSLQMSRQEDSARGSYA